MNFEKFRSITPKNESIERLSAAVSEKDARYIEKLKDLGARKERRVLRAVGVAAAVVAVTAGVSLWAVLGVGVRGGFESERGQSYVAAAEDTQENKNAQLQSFFDDYVNGKPCSFSVTENGKTTMSLSCAENGRTKYTHDGRTDTFLHMKFMLNTPDMGEDGYKGGAIDLYEMQNAKGEFAHDEDKLTIINFDLSGIVNNYQNSDRVCDRLKTEGVVITDGEVLEGEHSLRDFFYNAARRYRTFELSISDGDARFILLTYTGDTEYEIDPGFIERGEDETLAKTKPRQIVLEEEDGENLVCHRARISKLYYADSPINGRLCDIKCDGVNFDGTPIEGHTLFSLDKAAALRLGLNLASDTLTVTRGDKSCTVFGARLANAIREIDKNDLSYVSCATGIPQKVLDGDADYILTFSSENENETGFSLKIFKGEAGVLSDFYLKFDFSDKWSFLGTVFRDNDFESALNEVIASAEKKLSEN